MSLPLPLVSCPPEIRIVADEFKDLVSGHYKAFVAVLCAYIFGFSNNSSIFRFLLFSPSVSSLSRFFDDLKLAPKLNRRHRRRVQKILDKVGREPGRFIWAIDDTLIPHWGKNIWGTYYWHDHNSKGSVFGHKLMVLGLVDTKRKILIPVFWEILHQKKVTGEAHEKGWEVALKLLNLAIEGGFSPSTVVLDSWFSGKEFMEKLTQMGLDFVVEIKSNRIVAGHGRKKIRKSVSDFFSERFRHPIFYLGRKKWAAESVLQLKDLDQKLKIIGVANKKGLVHGYFAYYASNRLTWDGTKIWEITRDRWAIEVQFRELKQLFTLGGAAVRSKQAVETTISISMIALTVIRLEQISRADASKNQNRRPIPAISIVQEIQLRSLKLGLTRLAANTSSQIQEKFKSRLSLNNFRGKPTEGNGSQRRILNDLKR